LKPTACNPLFVVNLPFVPRHSQFPIVLRWRLTLGALLIVGLVALAWQDHSSRVPGAWLMPGAVVLALLATHEVLRLATLTGSKPLQLIAHVGALAVVLSAWMPLAWNGGAGLPPGNPFAAATPLAVLGVAVLALFVGEMWRYRPPGSDSGVERTAAATSASAATKNLAASVLAVVYVGGMFALLVQLRMFWGIAALATLVIPVKLGDTGAYFVGRAFGRRKFAPLLSPSKTLEGAAAQILCAAAASWATFHWLVPLLCTPPPETPPSPESPPWWATLGFGAVLGAVSILADLAESLLKRDAKVKDSSTWMPGLGGVLDMLDSLLLTAPVAWLFWALVPHS
jgi:phosphatidate cytidylyltransferase